MPRHLTLEVHEPTLREDADGRVTLRAVIQWALGMKRALYVANQQLHAVRDLQDC